MDARIRDRLEKVKALMDSPVPGEAQAAKALYDEMLAKYGDKGKAAHPSSSARDIAMKAHELRQQWMSELGLEAEKAPTPEDQDGPIIEAADWLESNGFAILSLAEDSLYVTPYEDVGDILFRDLTPDDLPAVATLLREAA